MPTENIMDWEKELVEQYKEPHQSTSESNDRKDCDNEEDEGNDNNAKEKPFSLDYSDALGLLCQLHWFASLKDGDLLPGINKLTDHVEQKISEKRRQINPTYITDVFGSTQNIYF